MGGTITAGSPYDITLTLAVTRGGTTPIDVEHPVVTVKGGSLTTGFDLNANLHFQFDTSKPADQKLYLVDSENPNVTLGFDADANFSSSPFNINLGIAKLAVGGTADLGVDFTAGINDPDGDGHITRAEFSSSAPEVLFSVACGPASHATLDLDLTSSISGLGSTTGTVDMNDTTPCSGLDTPSVNLGSLADFKNMTASDLLSSIAQLASSLNALENVGPAAVRLPFLKERLTDVTNFSEKLVKFFQDSGLSAVPPETGDDCVAGDTTDDDDDGFVNDGCPAVSAAETGGQCTNATDDDSDGYANDGCPAKTNNPLDLDITADDLLNFDTIDEVIPAVETALGLSPGDLGLAYDPTSKQLTFHIAKSGGAIKAGTVDFSDQLQSLGIVDVDAATASASVDANYSLDFTAGLDLTRYGETGAECTGSADNDGDGVVNDGCPAVEAVESACTDATDDDSDGAVNDGCPTVGPSIVNRVFIKTDQDDPQLAANFETDANLDLRGRIGFLGLDLHDNGGSDPVPIIGKRADDDGDMIRIELKGGDDPDKLTLGELLDGLIDDETSATDLTPTDIFGNLDDIVNVAVPEFQLDASADVSGTELLSGSIKVKWDDVLLGHPNISPQGNFNEKFLSFDFDHADPLALLSRIIDTLDTFTSSLDDLMGGENALNTPLPLIGKSFKDLVDQIQAIKAKLEEIVNDPSATLQDFEAEFETLLGGVLGIPEADRDGLLEITATTASPTVLTFKLGIGICSAEDGSDADRCDAIKPVDIPLNLNMSGEAISSLVGLESGGTLSLIYSAVADLNFRIKLPDVTPDGGDADPFPDVSGAPSLWLLDSSGIDLDATLQTSPDTTVTAHLGPLEVGVGSTAETAESGTECDNGDDDDQDGWVNDGCPAVDTAESGSDCGDAVDAGEDDPDDGKVNDGCPVKANPAVAKASASFSVRNDVDSDGEVDEIDVANATDLGNYFSGLVPGGFDISPDTPVLCSGVTQPAGDLAACARLPIYVGSALAGVIKFGATDLLDPSTWHFDVPPDLVANIFANALNFDVLLEGLNDLLETLKNTLDGASYGATVPGIGKAFQAGADVVQSLQNLIDQVQGLIDDLNDPTATPTAGDVETKVEAWLNDGLGTLLDGSSIDIRLKCDTGSGPADCAATDPVGSIVDAAFVFSFGETAAEAHPKFDIGFPGLRLRADQGTTIDASVDWNITLGFGISKADGFYVMTNPTGTASDPEVSIEAGIDLPDNGTTAPDLKGDLAFLRLNIEDTHDADPDVDFGFSANVTGGTDGKLTLSTLSSGIDPAGFQVKLHGGVHLHLALGLTAEIPGQAAQDGGLPELKADFALEWSFGTALAIGAGSGLGASLDNDLDISFDNVRLDLGSFLDDFLKPIVDDVQRFLKPIQPVIDLISAPIPGIAQLAKLVGATPPTMLDLFDAATGGELTFVRRVIALISFINAIPDGSSFGSIPLGDFDIDGSLAADRALPGNEVEQLIKNPTLDSGLGPNGVLGEFGGGFQSILDTATGSGEQGGFEFPAFQHPEQLFQLLVGKDVTLIEWRSGPLKAEFVFEQSFGPIMVGPIPLSIQVSFSAGIEGRFAVGYDTAGIRKTIEVLTDGDSSNDDAFTVLSAVFYGVFLDDLDSNGKDVPEIQLFAEGAVGVALDLVIVSAGVEGGIRATILMNLHDGPWPPATSPGVVDGKIRIDEILSRIGNPICLFDVSGKLEAFIRAFVKVGIGPFSKKFSFQIVKITLLDLKDITASICNVKPVLAEIHGGVLQVNIGHYAANRKINTGEKKEKVTVRQLRADKKKFSVTGFGITQVFPATGVASTPLTVFADGADGNDTILMDKGPVGSDQGGGTPAVSTTTIDFTANTILCGGSGDDRIVGGDGHDEMQGDGGWNSAYTCSAGEASTDGGDELNGRGGPDTINGQGGPDELAGEDGDDTLDGGTGDDSVTGGPGSDGLRGGPEAVATGKTDADRMQGGPEANVNDGTTNDTINGGYDSDAIEGEAGHDVIHGGLGDDSLIGGKNDDDVFGDGDNDVVNGSDGNDWVRGGPGDDDVLGDPGNDTVDGGPGYDDLYGAAGNDTLNGGADRDYILGDEGLVDRPAGQANANSFDLTSPSAGNDTENGDAGNDVMFGQGGTDTMNGNANNDEMHGNDGADTMNGNEDVDTMYGDPGNDTMNGNAGDDVMRGGDNDDTMHGNENADDMNGDAGNDTMYGDDGDDLMRGSTGDDVMQGNANHDEMYGDANEDRMFGNTGPDTMFGNADHDYMEGNADVDTMSGGPADDDMIGGTSTEGSSDAGDVMNGDEGTDTMAGDNAQITRNSPPAVKLLDVPFITGPAPAAGSSGNDTMHGNAADDRMYGQSGNDQMFGDAGDDYMEGNAGKDELHGGDDLDDMAGGSGHDEGGASGATRLFDNVNDDSVGGDGDQMFGDGNVDYMAGDNANITRPGGVRQIALYDVNFAGGTVFSSLLAGNDTMHGGDSNDLMYGQADQDNLFGDDGQDYMEGNEGRDLMEGNAADDKMVGGSGQDNGGIGGALRKLANAVDDNVPAATPAGQLQGDQMWGNGAADSNAASDGIDYMSGDNSFITGLGAGRKIELYDIPFSGTPIPGEVSGDDMMRGNRGNDVMYGQGDQDTMSGDENDDYMEGNSARDTMHGNDDQDDMLGGSGKDDGGPSGSLRELRNVRDVGDLMYGDEAVDYMAGDNARLDRDGVNHWDPAAAARQVVLYDIQTIDGPSIPQDVSGPDYMEGNNANDVIFGEGNGTQPATSGDPADGVDNDRDARESAASDPSVAGYDCADGMDNDGDGQTDGPDPQCVLGTDEDSSWDGDELHGGNGDDYMEGNHGADWMFGEGNEDDMAGGGSELADENSRGVWPASSIEPTKLKDGNDVLEGGPDDDAIAGDNAFFERIQTASSWQRLTGGNGFDLVRRKAFMTHSPDPAGAFGKDFVRGGPGNDDEYGEQGNDYMQGNDDQDAMVGDLGLIENNIIGAADGIPDPGNNQFIDINPPFIEDTIFEAGSLYRLTTLYSGETGQGAEGQDVMVGNAGNDSMHGAGGDDYMNGNGDYNPADVNSTKSSDGEDHLFGGDGGDGIWGGLGHDHIFGGHGDDHMDTIPRPYLTTGKKGEPIAVAGDDPPIWFELARVGLDNLQGTDYIYGGFDKDEMQASYGRPGPRPGDRLIDWVGNTNLYYTCPGAYGEGVITREHSPDMQAFLENESRGDGAIASADPTSSGFRELALIHPGEENGNPAYDGHPGHFVCAPMEVGLAAADLKLSATQVSAGAPVTISATLHNASTEVGDGEVVVKFSANGKEIGRGIVDGIDPGSSETAVLNWDTTNRNGPQQIQVTVDPDNLLVEGNENDNSASTTLTIVNGADLALAQSNLTLSSSKVVAGDKVTVRATVRNIGGAARDIAVRFTDNGAALSTQTVSNLAAGSSTTLSATWRTKVAGAHTIAVAADPDGTIEETNEANNSASVAVNVLPNKVKNPSYETSTTGTTPDNWTGTGTAATYTNTLASEGMFSVRAASSAYWLSDEVPVTPGILHGLALDSIGGLSTLTIKQYSDTGKALTATSQALTATTDWREFRTTFTANAKAAYIRVMLVGGLDGTPTTFDEVRVWSG